MASSRRHCSSLAIVGTLILTIAEGLLFAAEKTGGSGAPGGLDDFFKLNEKLSRAVCDEAIVSRAPTLEATRDSFEERAPLESFAPVGEGMQAISRLTLDLKIAASESQLISFLLGDRTAMLPSAHVARLLGGVTPLEELRRKTSLEVCTAMVTPGKLDKLMSVTPSWFLPAAPAKADSRLPVPDVGSISVRLQDVEWRFGKVNKKWWVAGWVEPHEILTARAGRGGVREYRRLANPITNRTQLIEIVGKNDLPLGYLFPSAEATVLDWSALKVRAENEANRQRQIEAYRFMMELEAYRAVSAQSRNADAVRKLQEFYRSLMNAYRLYPNDAQFVKYGVANRRLMAESEIRKTLDEEFSIALKASSVNGSRVSLGVFLPDPRLHGMFEEYRDRLRRAASPTAGGQ